MPLPPLAFFRDDLRMSTWLLIGASLQCVLCLVLPVYVASVPTLLIIAGRAIQSALIIQGVLRDPSLDRVVKGRFTAQIPFDDGSFPDRPADKEVVLLVLGARSNHPKGRFAPDYQEIGHFFRRMWQDAAANREKWGFLGKTSTLLATDNECGNTMIWLSYWRDMDHLHAFARGDAHRKGWDWWSAAKHLDIGIMHETYAAPRGHWETIYHNFRPFGMGQTKYLMEGEPTGNDEKPRFNSPLKEAKGSNWKSMTSRMGRTEIS